MTYNPRPYTQKPSTNLYLPFEKGCFVYKRGSSKYHGQCRYEDKTQVSKQYDNKEDAIAFVNCMKQLTTRPAL